MISAPIVPRTRQSLWDLLESEPERLERGFALVQRELVIADGLVVEGLGRDTSGRLVLVYLCSGEGEDLDVAQRVFAIDQWVRRNDRLLLGVLAESGIRSVSPPRTVVLGFEFSESAVNSLRSMSIDDLSILRCEAFILDGQLHAGLSPVLGPTAAGEHDTMTIPGGVVDERLRQVGEDILDVMRRLAPNIQVQGDRYSRRFSSEHGPLAELFLDGDRLYFQGIGDDLPSLVTDARSRDIKDSIVRSYRDQLSRPASRSERDAALSASLADRLTDDISSAPAERSALRIDHALHPLPRAPLVGEATLSQEEFSAFDGMNSDSIARDQNDD